MSADDFISPIIYQLGVGGIGGFLVGYAIKKILKILAVVVGIIVFIIMYLGYSDIISVNYDKLMDVISKALPSVEGAPNILVPFLSALPFAGSFAFGLIYGFKKG